MKKKNKILWIEDNARYDLSHYVGPVYMDGSYDLDVVEDATTAVDYLQRTEYRAIIVDIRIPPGESEEWINLYQGNGGAKIAARLGHHLLYTILRHKDAEIKIKNMPVWITAEKIGILTVESISELAKDFSDLKLYRSLYSQKIASAPETILLDLIKNVIKQSQEGGKT